MEHKISPLQGLSVRNVFSAFVPTLAIGCAYPGGVRHSACYREELRSGFYSKRHAGLCVGVCMCVWRLPARQAGVPVGGSRGACCRCRPLNSSRGVFKNEVGWFMHADELRRDGGGLSLRQLYTGIQEAYTAFLLQPRKQNTACVAL